LGGVASATLLVSCGLSSRGGTGVVAETEVILTDSQPRVAVEFEASFESLVDDSGIFASLMVNSPSGPDEFADLPLDGGFQQEVWNGQSWEPLSDDPEVYRIGTNVFRYRWVLRLKPGVSIATIPIEGEMLLHYGHGAEVVPGEQEYRDLKLEITAVHSDIAH
jgi:hypothetical protein